MNLCCVTSPRNKMRRRVCRYIQRANMSMAPNSTGLPLAFIIVQVVLVILALIPIIAGVDLNSRTVKTKYGDLKGVIVKLERNLGGVEVFRGVPYASPPVGSLRFMPPVNGAPWHGVKVADKFGPVCPQKLPELTNAMPAGRVEYLRRLLPLLRNQSEDCLYLNIYAPAQGNFPEIIVTKCQKCTEKQKSNFEYLVEWYTANHPEEWQALVAKFIEDAKAMKIQGAL